MNLQFVPRASCLPTSDGCCTDAPPTGSKWQLGFVSVSQRLNGETSRADGSRLRASAATPQRRRPPRPPHPIPS